MENRCTCPDTSRRFYQCAFCASKQEPVEKMLEHYGVDPELVADQDVKPSNLVVLKPAPAVGAQPNAEVIEMLEKLLAQAERGEIRSMAFTCELLEGELSTGFTKPENTLTIAAGVGLLQHRYFAVHWGNA